MRKSIIGAVGLSLSTLAIAASAETNRDFDFTGFDEIVVSAGNNVDITVANKFSITATADKEDHLDRLDIKQKGDRLYISTKKSKSWRSGRYSTEVSVTLPSLNGLHVSSGAKADASGIESDDLELTVSSGAVLKADGTCDFVKANSSSGASMSAKGLSCKEGDLGASSGSGMKISISDSVEASASSGAGISVYGEPRSKDINSSSGGRVRIK